MARDLLPLTRRVNAELLRRRWPAMLMKVSNAYEDMIVLREPTSSMTLFVGNDFIDMTAMRKSVIVETRRLDLSKHTEDEAVGYVVSVFEGVWTHLIGLEI